MIENSEKIVRCFKIFYIIGIGLVIASFFSEWYYYAYIINRITMIWGYNIIAGWNCITNNSINYPISIEIDLMLFLLYIFIFFLAVISFIYISLERPLFSKKNFYNKVKTLNYIFPVYLGFNLIILALFLFNLFQANFYFPFLKLYIVSEDSETLYWFGPGCILHMISFIFMFPFSAIVLQIPRKFKLKENKIEINKLIEVSSKNIDFEKIIMKERIKKDKTFNQSSNGKLQKGKFNLDNIRLESES